jgi:L-alanine-DL-glutamate epimerase-like enolase superfamily enzyme
MLAANRDSVGSDYPVAVDCWTGLDVSAAIELGEIAQPLGLAWIEEPLHAEDIDGFRRLSAAFPKLRWTTGEHRATRYGFRQLVTERLVHAVQPDLRWCGGMTEALRIVALAAAFDVAVMPHHGGVYSYHLAASQMNVAMVEFLNTSPGGDAITPLAGSMFEGEPLPREGVVRLDDAPGFGLRLTDEGRRALRRPFPRQG